jgi:hypothetical protein
LTMAGIRLALPNTTAHAKSATTGYKVLFIVHLATASC